MQKVRYEIDPYNRLIVSGSGLRSDLRKFRQVIDGKFKLDGDNNLSYHVKSPLSKCDNLPNQIKLSGEWSLTDDHELRLTLDKSARETFGDRITLQGDILDVGKNSLLFAMTTTTKDDTLSTYVLNIGGSWKADENNRLSFHVRRERGGNDILTFTGAWEVGKGNQIIYKYEKAALRRRKRQTHALMFKGYWDIKDRVRISYVLGRDTDSVFDFEAAAGIFKERYIRYEIGIGAANSRRYPERTVRLFGRWNLKRGSGLVFEAEYGNKATKTMAFGADVKLTDKDTVLFKLKNDIENRNIGIDLELSRKIFKGEGEAFLRALASKGESAIYAGAAWRW
ncbi:MAG: hypothetical protein V1682_01555 [Candidatus Omnitrophota bacterium]